jgi:hypothetical protein
VQALLYSQLHATGVKICTAHVNKSGFNKEHDFDFRCRLQHIVNVIINKQEDRNVKTADGKVRDAKTMFQER